MAHTRRDRRRASELHSTSQGVGMNPVPLQRAQSVPTATEQRMRRKASVQHKSHHKFDESRYQATAYGELNYR